MSPVMRTLGLVVPGLSMTDRKSSARKRSWFSRWGSRVGSHSRLKGPLFLKGLILSNLNRERRVATALLPGVRFHELRRKGDGRGSLEKIFGKDWRDLLGEDKVIQSTLSYSSPGLIRAWHRHSRGQI